MRILIVEDDTVLGAFWHEMFTDAGHDTMIANHAGEARRLLLTTGYDAVVLDLHLDGESGLSLATIATYANPDCRVVMVTGSNLFARGELFTLAPNLSAVLRKPVGIEEMMAVLETEASTAANAHAAT